MHPRDIAHKCDIAAFELNAIGKIIVRRRLAEPAQTPVSQMVPMNERNLEFIGGGFLSNFCAPTLSPPLQLRTLSSPLSVPGAWRERRLQRLIWLR